MRNQVLAIVATAMLAGCEYAPTAIAMSENSTTIRYDPVLYSESDAAAVAQDICARYGRRASPQMTSGIGTKYASYDCVKP